MAEIENTQVMFNLACGRKKSPRFSFPCFWTLYECLRFWSNAVLHTPVSPIRLTMILVLCLLEKANSDGPSYVRLALKFYFYTPSSLQQGPLILTHKAI